MEKIRNANGTIPTHKLRMSMKVTMQTKCGVFRENQLLTEGSSLFNHLFISQVKEIHYYRYMYFPIKKTISRYFDFDVLPGVEEIQRWFKQFAHIRTTDRSKNWNSDVIETLELQNMLQLAVQVQSSVPQP